MLGKEKDRAGAGKKWSFVIINYLSKRKYYSACFYLFILSLSISSLSHLVSLNSPKYNEESDGKILDLAGWFALLAGTNERTRRRRRVEETTKKLKKKLFSLPFLISQPPACFTKLAQDDDDDDIRRLIPI